MTIFAKRSYISSSLPRKLILAHPFRVLSIRRNQHRKIPWNLYQKTLPARLNLEATQPLKYARTVHNRLDKPGSVLTIVV